MSALPQQILAPSQPLGRLQADGSVRISENWWLLLYNLSARILGTGEGQGLPGDALQDLAGVDADAVAVDAQSLVGQLAALEALQNPAPPDPSPSLAAALLLAQEPLLQDPVPVAGPMASIAVGASPASYTALRPGHVAVTGGTVTDISVTRYGTTITIGLLTGLVPVCRGDTVTVTYSAAPTMTFVPWSTA